MKPRILFILHLPPPVHGAAMMGKYIHDSKLINESFDCHYINLTTAKNLEDIGHFRPGKIVEFAKLLHKIRKAINQLHPDLVYVTPNAKGGAFYKDFIVVEMIKSMGCKVIVHYHNKGVATRQDRWLDDKLYKRFFKGLKVILLAEALYPDVQKYVKRENVFICPNGIPDETNGIEPSAERHNKVPHILFLSNLIISKGVLVLLDALKILKERGYSFVCDFVGGETAEIDASRFQKEVEERGLNQIVFYAGRKYGKDKDAYFKRADVFAFPTSLDCFPLVLLEAMQHKLPIVSTDEGGIPEIIKNNENGLIALKNKSSSLAECLSELLDNKNLREKMGEDGYEKFKQYFTQEAFENHFKECISKVVRGGVILDSVLYFGKRFRKEKEIFWREADIFVFPTFYPNECFPLVLLEAMQHGVPCISTNEGGIPDIIENGKTGMLAYREDAADLAEKIQWMIDHPSKRQIMGRQGWENYRNKFTLSAFEYRFSGILKQIVN